MNKIKLSQIKYNQKICDVLGLLNNCNSLYLIIKYEDNFLAFTENYINELTKNYEIQKINNLFIATQIEKIIKNKIEQNLYNTKDEIYKDLIINIIDGNNKQKIDLMKDSEFKNIIDNKLCLLLSDSMFKEKENSNLSELILQPEVVNTSLETYNNQIKEKKEQTFKEAFVDVFLLSAVVGTMTLFYAIFLLIAIL